MCCVLLDLLNNKCYMEMSKAGQTEMEWMLYNSEIPFSRQLHKRWR